MAKSTKKPATAKATKKDEKKVTTPTEKVITPEKRAELLKLIVAKYPDQIITPNSLMMPGEHKNWPTKRTIEITCQWCEKAKRRIATSDAHQTVTCSDDCRKAMKKAEVANDTKPAKPVKEKKI